MLDKDRQKIEAAQRKRHEEVLKDIRQGEAHTHMQLLLTKLGKALGYDVLVASNDRGNHFKTRSSRFTVCAACRNWG